MSELGRAKKCLRIEVWVFCLFASLLFLRTFQEQRWSDWTFGDAQTLLAVQNWNESGFLATSFLWIPQAYSDKAQLFDSPELKHHSHGTDGHRAYTHFPSWYAVPYGLLAKIGIYGKTPYQCFALILSLGAALLFGRFVYLYFSYPVALLAVGAYVLSRGFLLYSDSLANMPLDDFLRFGFLNLWEWHRRSANRQSFGYAWLCYFLLSLSSLDSIPFIALWALLTAKKKPFRTYAFQIVVLGCAPLFAFGIHFWQNASYLGAANAWQDWFSTFGSYSLSVNGTIWDWLLRAFQAIWGLAGASFRLGETLFVALGLCFLLNWQKRKTVAATLFPLLIAGSGFAFIFAAKVPWLHYEIRQLMPAKALFWALLAYGTYQWTVKNGAKKPVRAMLLVLLTLFITYHTHLRHFPTYVDIPAQTRLEPEYIQQAKQIQAYSENQHLVIDLGYYFPGLAMPIGHIQIFPVVEYYVGAPVLTYEKTDSLCADLKFLSLQQDTGVEVIVVRNIKGPRLNKAVECLEKDGFGVSQKGLWDWERAQVSKLKIVKLQKKLS